MERSLFTAKIVEVTVSVLTTSDEANAKSAEETKYVFMKDANSSAKNVTAVASVNMR